MADPSTASVRVRFAPSPTGYLHLGSARTALFNWLWARHIRAGGGEAEFRLRIEDTDKERSLPELVAVIDDSLRWLGLDWDGEVSHQSDGVHRHHAAVEALLTSGDAYRCSCTQDDVKARNAAAGGTPGYDGFCRDREVAADVAHVVRFRVPAEGSTGWVDMIRGEITFENRNLEDFVLRRTDGSPVFIVANAVDDAHAAITHVIRGEDLINATPKMILVRDALGITDPIRFAHLPLIVNEQRRKLSKRSDDVSIGFYRDRGIVAEAMVNYLALLGWGPPDAVEVRPLEEIVALFDIADVNPSPAMFDVRKLEAINGEYLRAMPVEDFVHRAIPFVERADWFDAARFDPARFEAIAPELQSRVKVLGDVVEMVDFLFLEAPVIDEAAWSKAVASSASAVALLDGAARAYEGIEWTADALHAATAALAEAEGLRLGKAQAPIRVAVTGRMVGPPLFESLVLLGRQETLRRLGAARARC